jgi:hypothetical protein
MIKIPDLDTKFLATSKLLVDMKSMNGVGREFTIFIENFQGRLKKIVADFKLHSQPLGPSRTHPQEEAKFYVQQKTVPSQQRRPETQVIQNIAAKI